MDEAAFWTIVEAAKSAASSSSGRPEALRAVLLELAPDDVQGFQEAYMAQVHAAYTWPLWGAAYVMNGGCSDDGFDYFRDWLISEGRSVFMAALQDPETLADIAAADDFELEEFRYVADEVYEARTGRPMEPDYPAFPGDPAGEAWDEDTVDRLFPRLAQKFG